MNGKVKPGYKQTEVGVIPEDWQSEPLANVLAIVGGGTPSTSVPEFWDGKIPWVSAGDVSRAEGRYVLDTVDRISELGLSSCPARILPKGTVVIIARGATTGRMAQLGSHMAFNQTCYGLRAAHGLDQDYLYYAMQYTIGSTGALAYGTIFRTITTQSFQQWRIPLPPLAEQQAIAEALSDADALVEALEQLIAKKRQIKLGAMQELLSQKKSDEVRLLEEISTLKGRIGWQGLKQSEFTTNADEPFLITGMNFKDGAIRWNEVYHISEERYEIAKDIQLRTGDVLMTKDGTIGKVLYIDEVPPPGKASLNSHLLLFRPIRDSYHPKYLYYQLISKRFKDFIELSKSGTTFFGLSQAAVGKYPVLLPPIQEQVEIAAILSDMDAELAALEARLAKARLVKQGMMQELLTGRIRLV